MDKQSRQVYWYVLLARKLKHSNLLFGFPSVVALARFSPGDYRSLTLCAILFSPFPRPSESPGLARTVLDTISDCCVFMVTSGGTRLETVDQAEWPSQAYAHTHPRTTHKRTFCTHPIPQPMPLPFSPHGAVGDSLTVASTES